MAQLTPDQLEEQGYARLEEIMQEIREHHEDAFLHIDDNITTDGYNSEATSTFWITLPGTSFDATYDRDGNLSDLTFEDGDFFTRITESDEYFQEFEQIVQDRAQQLDWDIRDTAAYMTTGMDYHTRYAPNMQQGMGYRMGM